MTAPIGPLSPAFSQLAQRVQDASRGIEVPVLPKGGGTGGVGGTDLGPSFKDTFTRALNEVSDARDRGAELAERFANGEDVELHQVMAASEEAGLALDLAIEMRNKVVEAYRSLINMQS
ncbi:MAG: flagellar hook-basal body complex protein FliE [Gemmatimonadaceae bacterium]|nr:flagellar hook-basal body complex protein FliE [Gemmatimonadaceae bacterium]